MPKRPRQARGQESAGGGAGLRREGPGNRPKTGTPSGMAAPGVAEDGVGRMDGAAIPAPVTAFRWWESS
ncbi:hypothetical protein GCM10007860_31490 [Chitiniphilus shinanonensis]|uniref:Uncharacterized protein n=1 Tax=Chitiniphilus shinanonensis TaxID=553088 RepID=A0ABQ6BVH2_9NEIS|nr:hypothetical protein GCM10007860_31490 [Chitiniphilus shinanonensis]